MTDSPSIEELRQRIRAFAAAREWEKFHDPKNLTMLLASEVGELVAEFRWLTPTESTRAMNDEERARRIADEIGDVGIALLALCDKLNIDLPSAIAAKIELNKMRYPAVAARGRPERPPSSAK
jgi:dCTP diphosphatase